MNYFIQTFGCQMNRHDSELISGMLRKRGWRPAPEGEAEVVLVNTCSVRRHAEERVLGLLRNYAGIRKRGGRPVVGVVGCMAQLWGKKLWEDFPWVDLIIGPGSFLSLPEALEGALTSRRRTLATSLDRTGEWLEQTPDQPVGVQAWVSVMRGCGNYCSYCVVPYARGRECSRSPEAIAGEVGRLAAEGCREITLLGQNIHAYRGLDRRGRAVDLPGLLRLLHPTAGIDRIRFVTSHPRDVSCETVETMRDLPKICECLHFPAQSGSDRILKKMNRGYTRREYLGKVEMARSAVPEVGLSSDFIVGFPGETEEDFSQTLSLIGEVRFDTVFAFRYSPRPLTPAAAFRDDVPPAVKSSRLQRVLGLQRAISRSLNQGGLGREVEVLVEGKNRRHPDRGEGKTRQGKPVFFPWEDGLAGELIRIKIERAGSFSLFGSRVAP